MTTITVDESGFHSLNPLNVMVNEPIIFHDGDSTASFIITVTNEAGNPAIGLFGTSTFTVTPSSHSKLTVQLAASGTYILHADSRGGETQPMRGTIKVVVGL